MATEGRLPARVEVSARQGGDQLMLRLSGSLDIGGIRSVWEECRRVLQAPGGAREILIDATGVSYCDGAGIGMLVDLQRPHPDRAEMRVQVTGLPSEYQVLLDLYSPADFTGIRTPKKVSTGFIDHLGGAAVNLCRDSSALVSFVGELSLALWKAALRPNRVRWREALLVAQNVGVDALPIVGLISFLMGLIMAFQSAIPMRQFGVELFVADLVALSMLRELGPLMTAILLAGRSGSAFAAELGTMKVNEELDALTTMGLDPVRFLVVTRVVAAVFVVPLLTLFANLMGLVGGGVVVLSMKYPLVTYVRQVLGAVDLADLFSGLSKSFVFGILVAGIGCLRGLQTGTGARAVGLSATRAVVSGIVLIVVADGIFSVIFYYLGI